MIQEVQLPAVHLRGETLTALEDLLYGGCTDPDIDISVEHGSVTYHYNSLSALRDDVGLPAVVRSFEVVITAREGHIEICSNRGVDGFQLSLRGNAEWVERRRRELTDFFARQGATFRTLLERYLGVTMTGATVLASLLVYHAGYGAAIGMQAPVDGLFFGSLAVFFGGLFHALLNVIYPYSAIISGEVTGR